MAGLGLEAAVMNILIGPKLTDTFGSTLGDQLDKAVGPAAEKASKSLGEKLTAGFDKAGKSLSKNVTAPILGLATSAIASSEKVDDALDVIRRSTGATGEEFNGLRADFEAIATSSAVNFERTAEIVSLLNQRLELTGKPLQEVGRALADLDTITGEQTNLDGFTRVLGAFNVPADQAVETINKLLRASQKTGVPVNKLTEGLVSQSAAFAELGFGLDETAALLGQFEASGVNTNTVLAGLRANIIRSTKASDEGAKATTELAKAQDAIAVLTLKAEAAQGDYNDKLKKYGEGSKEAISAEATLLDIRQKLESANTDAANSQQVLDEIVKSSGANAKGAAEFFRQGVKEIEGFLAAGDESAAQAAAAELFGARTFLDALDAIKRGQFDIEGTVSAIQRGQDTVGGLADEFEGLPEKFDQLKKSTVLALKPLGEELIPALTDALDAAVPIIQGFAEAFKNLNPETRRLIVIVGGLAAALGPTLLIFAKMISVIGQIGTALKAVTALLVANPWVLVAAAAIAAVVLIVKNWDTIAAFFSALWEGIASGAAALWNGLAGGAAAAFEAVKAAVLAGVEAIRALFSGVKNLGADIWNGLKNGTQAALQFVQNKINEAINKIRDTFARAANLGAAIWNGLRNGAQGAITAVANVAKGIVNSIAGAWNNTIARISFSLPSWIPKIGGSRWGVPKIPMLAEGGPAMANRPYIVGEVGPELFVPRVSGTVIPNNQLGGTMGDMSYSITINNPTAEPASTSIPNALRRATYLRG